MVGTTYEMFNSAALCSWQQNSASVEKKRSKVIKYGHQKICQQSS